MVDPSKPRSPLVRLLQRYVLAVIGRLSPAHEAEAARLVQLVFKTREPWRDVLREQFGLTDELDAQLCELWKDGQQTATAQGATLGPEDFAAMVVDENFSDALEMLATELTHGTDTSGEDD